MSESKDFFKDNDNVAELVSHMPAEEQQRWHQFGHLRIESAFQDRIFVVYKPTGLTPSGRHKEPEIVNVVRITDFTVSARGGCVARLREQNTDQEMLVTHVPKLLWNYPIFVAIPPRIMIRWDAREVNDKVYRSLSFALWVKTRNRADFYSKGNTYMETPNDFQAFYPDVTGKFRF